MISDAEIISTCCCCDEEIFEDQEYRSSNCGEIYWHYGCYE